MRQKEPTFTLSSSYQVFYFTPDADDLRQELCDKLSELQKSSSTKIIPRLDLESRFECTVVKHSRMSLSSHLNFLHAAQEAWLELVLSGQEWPYRTFQMLVLVGKRDDGITHNDIVRLNSLIRDKLNLHSTEEGKTDSDFEETALRLGRVYELADFPSPRYLILSNKRTHRQKIEHFVMRNLMLWGSLEYYAFHLERKAESLREECFTQETETRSLLEEFTLEGLGRIISKEHDDTLYTMAAFFQHKREIDAIRSAFDHYSSSRDRFESLKDKYEVTYLDISRCLELLSTQIYAKTDAIFHGLHDQVKFHFTQVQLETKSLAGRWKELQQEMHAIESGFRELQHEYAHVSEKAFAKRLLAIYSLEPELFTPDFLDQLVRSPAAGIPKMHKKNPELVPSFVEAFDSSEVWFKEKYHYLYAEMVRFTFETILSDPRQLTTTDFRFYSSKWLDICMDESVPFYGDRESEVYSVVFNLNESQSIVPEPAFQRPENVSILERASAWLLLRYDVLASKLLMKTVDGLRKRSMFDPPVQAGQSKLEFMGEIEPAVYKRTRRFLVRLLSLLLLFVAPFVFSIFLFETHSGLSNLFFALEAIAIGLVLLYLASSLSLGKNYALNSALPRLLGAIVVGCIPLFTEELLKFSLYANVSDHATISIILLAGVYFYLFIQVSSRIKTRSKALIRAASVGLIGLTESLVILFVFSTTVGPQLISILEIETEMPSAGMNAPTHTNSKQTDDTIHSSAKGGTLNRSPYLGAMPRKIVSGLRIWDYKLPFEFIIYPPLIFFGAVVALFVGIFIQLMWHDKPITQPI